MNRIGFAFASGALLALSACARVDYIPLNAAPRAMPPRAPAQVAMFQTTVPDRPYVEVANIEVQGGGSASVMERLREEAGEHGCEGLVLIGTKDSNIVTASGPNITTTHVNGYRGTCIVFKEPAATTSTSAVVRE